MHGTEWGIARRQAGHRNLSIQIARFSAACSACQNVRVRFNIMCICYSDLVAFLPITQSWRSLDSFRFNLEVWATSDALDGLITCWDKKSTIASYANSSLQGTPEELIVTTCATTFDITRPYFAVVFSKSTLNRLWPDEYPTPGHELIVLDGNKRLQSLVIRRNRNLQLPTFVGVFVCQRGN